MKWAVLAARVLVGLMFTVLGLNFFLKFMPVPPPESGSPAATFLGVLVGSGYLTAVKLLEISGGLMLLAGRLPLIGLTILTPVSLNILFYELFLLKAPGPGYVLLPLCVFLVWAYRTHFASVFALNPKVG